MDIADFSESTFTPDLGTAARPETPELEFRGNRRHNVQIMRKSRKNGRDFADRNRREALDNSNGADRFVLDARALRIFQEPVRTPGRPRRHIPDELFSLRDRLVWFLESNWPELEPLFRRARSANDIERALEPYRAYDPAPYLVAHKEKLSEFLTSSRYHGDPRQIANAMAGVDTLSWRRSLDLCSTPENRCTLFVHERAWRDLMRRKFHDRFLLLRRAEKLDDTAAIKQISAIMRGTRTHDENVRVGRNRPEEVLRLLRGGIPNPPRSS